MLFFYHSPKDRATQVTANGVLTRPNGNDWGVYGCFAG